MTTALRPHPIIKLNACGPLAKKARGITLNHDDPTAENSLDHPDVIVLREAPYEVPGSEFRHTFPANSVTVLRSGNR